MTRRHARATRRGFLALAGTATLAGCNGFGRGVLGDDPPEIDGEALAELASTDPPAVPETVPVDIRQSYLDDGASRARDLLESVPAPFDAEEIPNGAIRRELSRRHERANEAVASVADAESSLEAMGRLRRARGEARAVAAAWRAIDEGLSRADVRADARSLFEATDRFRSRWAHVGADPVPAVLVHATVETRVGAATNWAENVVTDDSDRDGPTAVGELADHLEVGRASLDDAGHLYDRLRASAGDPRDLRPAFVAAADSLETRVRRRRGRLPDGDPDDPSSFVDGDVDGTPVRAAIGDLALDLERDSGVDRARGADEYASAVVAGHETLVRLRALNSLRRRVAEDEHVTVESAADAREIRADAVTALEDALEAGEGSHLRRAVLSDAADVVAVADRELGRYGAGDAVSVGSIARELGEYVRAAAMARATPQTSEEVGRLVRQSG